MRDPDEFDAFYKAARHRLLLQTYALTGDLPAARGAVRDAFVAAWHHWRKVSRLDDPEEWARPHAWQHAQRRHTARIWHRDRSLDPELRATLDALAKLTTDQRRVLLLTQLSSISMTQMAREAGLADDVAEQQLQLATAHFASHRGVPASEIRQYLGALGERTEEVRFPRTPIIRRAGSARRRAHTGAGIAGIVAALLVSGTVVGQADGVTPGLQTIRKSIPAVPDDSPASVPRLVVGDLLTADQARALAPNRAWGTPTTDDNTGGTGINTICQTDRFADPAGVGALVRRFPAAGAPALSVLQVVEHSLTAEAAQATYDKVIGWYAGCRDERVQLISAHAVSGAGDQATVLVLRDWSSPVTTYSVGVARTGALVSTVVHRVADGRNPNLAPLLALLAGSVTSLCDQDDAGACAGRPGTAPMPPPAAPTAPGMLQVVDLPPVTRVDKPWIATDPVAPAVNPAATTCDRADFRGPGLTQGATRSFLIPQAALPRSFGVGQTLARFPTDAAARQFVATLRTRMNACEDKNLSATVRPILQQTGPTQDLGLWRLTMEISDNRAVDYYVALIRRGAVVTEVTFIPAKGADLGRGAFVALSQRALARLANLPPK